jgi:hypothetical protein
MIGSLSHMFFLEFARAIYMYGVLLCQSCMCSLMWLYGCMVVWLYGCLLVSKQGNSLTGSIPSSVGLMTGLTKLVLSVSIGPLDVVFGPSGDWAYSCMHTNKLS